MPDGNDCDRLLPERRPRPPQRGWSLLIVGLFVAILVPWLLLDGWIQQVGAEWLGAVRDRPIAAALAVVALLAVDVVLPIPSSLVGVFAGSALGLARGALAIWVGLMIGCLVGDAFGAWLGRRLGGRWSATIRSRRWVAGVPPSASPARAGVPDWVCQDAFDERRLQCRSMPHRRLRACECIRAGSAPST